MQNLLLDRYKVLEQAGKGGFASVLVAWDTRIQRKVAIKCLPLNQQATQELNLPAEATSTSILIPEIAQRTSAIPGLDEARCAAMLNDANIVSVYDFEVQDDMAYIILEYVEGITLAELLALHASEITPDIIAAVFKAVSHALEVAHKNKVLHLDIKPENVLIDKQGQVKVVDFGLARLAGEYGFGSAEGGTIGYMPPEQMDQEELDERCDEWALASLTYEMITGSNPFIAQNLSQARKKIEGAELVVPSMYLEEAHESVDDIMFCALDPNREYRYDTVAAFAHEMRQCLGDPRKGKKELARIVGALDEEEELPAAKAEEANFVPATISARFMGVIRRVVVALCVGFMGYTSMTFAPFLPDDWASPASWVVLVISLALGALIPSVGVAVGLCFFGVVLISLQAYIAGIVIILGSIFWWYFKGRNNPGSVTIAAAIPLFGVAGLMPVAVLLAGCFLRIKDALCTVVFSALVAFVFSGLGTGSLLGWNFEALFVQKTGEAINAVLLVALQNPNTWLMTFAWIVSAALLVLCSVRSSLVLRVVGIVVSVFSMLAALIGGALILSAGASFLPEAVNVASVVVSGMLGIAVLFITQKVTIVYPE